MQWEFYGELMGIIILYYNYGNSMGIIGNSGLVLDSRDYHGNYMGILWGYN